MNKSLSDKYNKLQNIIHGYSKIAIAFSGGVDSTFLLKVAKDCLGENVLAVTCHLASFPEREKHESLLFCKENDIRQITTSIDEFEIEGFSRNPPNRCYFCKKALFSEMIKVAQKEGFDILAEGSNRDDEGDYRPGLLALDELKIKSPLRLAGLTKDDIRSLSGQLGLKTADKPSFACLSTRIPYGETITKEKLSIIEQGEDLLYRMGFSQFRLRFHGEIARIEVYPEDFSKIIDEKNRSRIVSALQDLGFTYITLDLNGFCSGSMNVNIKQ